MWAAGMTLPPLELDGPRNLPGWVRVRYTHASERASEEGGGEREAAVRGVV